jgi:hypothetical protein
MLNSEIESNSLVPPVISVNNYSSELHFQVIVGFEQQVKDVGECVNATSTASKAS